MKDRPLVGYVCIGGPKDGHKVVNDRMYFHCALRQNDWHQPSESAVGVLPNVHTFTYAKKLIPGQHVDFVVWVPEMTTNDDLIAHLLSTYAGARSNHLKC